MALCPIALNQRVEGLVSLVDALTTRGNGIQSSGELSRMKPPKERSGIDIDVVIEHGDLIAF